MSCSAAAFWRSSPRTARATCPVGTCSTTAGSGCRATWCRTWSSSARSCREPRPARSTGPASPRSSTSWRRPETAGRTEASRHTEGTCSKMETVINEYISREFVKDPALLPLADEAPLLDSGILDSLSLLRLVVFLEERFGITMGDSDLLPEYFASVNAICAYLRAREPGKQQASHG